MKSTFVALSALLGSTALASPTPTREKRAAATTDCGQYETVSATPYQLATNLWGQANGQGSQCASLISVAGSTISWSTNWTWSGGQNQVKSYSNVGLQMQPTQLSSITGLPTTWAWNYTGSNLVADVSYDMFTANTSDPTAAHQFEIMVWLAALGGAGPISATGSPVATATIGGTAFNLSQGTNGATTVYSFVATTPVQSFSGDLIDFYNYLEQNQGFSSAQYLQSVQAGTEPFTGSDAVLTTTSYSIALNT